MNDQQDRRRLRAGIIGGGRGAFIGAVHRSAAELDGQALVVAGAMSSDPETAQRSAAAWFLDRSYDSYATMALEEPRRPDGIDFVIIATPNDLHYPVAKAFLAAGIHVVPAARTCEAIRYIGTGSTAARKIDRAAHIALRDSFRYTKNATQAQ